MLDYLFTKTPLLFFTQNLWRDEAFSYVLASKSILDIIKFSVQDFSPPLYYIFLHFWIRIFGHSEVMLRSLSLIFYIGTLYVVYAIFQEVFRISKLKSVFYLLLFILNPFLCFYAFEARMYMMVTFFVTLSYYAFWLKKRRLYIVSMTLALYTHYFAAFILLIQTIEFLISSRFWKNFRFVKITSSFILSGLIFLPWLLYFVTTHDFSNSSFWVIQPPLKDILYMPFILYTGYERIFGEYYHTAPGYIGFHTYLLVLLTVIFFFPVVHYIMNLKHLSRVRKPNSLVVSLGLWAFFTPITLFILSFIAQPFYHPRYFIFTSVGFILLLVYAFERYFKPEKSIFLKYGGIILFILLIVMTNRFNSLNLKYRSKRNVSQMASEIKARMSPHDTVFVTSELDYHLYQYYLQRDDIKIYGKTYEEIPQYVGKVLIPEDALQSLFPVYPRRAFIIYYNSYTTRAIY